VTTVTEIGPYTFMPGAIARKLVDEYAAEVQPKVSA
jgi:branched-chain amino acid aminotransferase